MKNEAAAFGSKGHDAFDEYFKIGKPLPQQYNYLTDYVENLKNNLGKVESEKEIAFDEDWNRVGWWDDDCYQRGKLDIYKKEGDRGTIVDHKFGKFSPMSLENYTEEMKYFTLLTMKDDEEVEKVKTVVTWLKGDSKPTSAIYTRDDLSEIEDNFASKISLIEDAIETEEFTYTQSGLCNGWCANTTCKFWKPKQ